MTPLAFTLPFLLFFGLSLAQNPIHVPLTRRSRVARAFNPTDEAQRLRAKYYPGAAAVRRGPQGRRATSSGVSIINQVIISLTRSFFLAHTSENRTRIRVTLEQ